MRGSSWITLTVVMVAVVLTVITASFTYLKVRDLVIESPVEIPLPPQAGSPRPTATPIPPSATPAPVTTSAVAATAATTIPALSDPERVTILLLGIDARPGDTDVRTDTIMVLSLDPIRKTAVMLSIPRDIYLNIPGYKPNRINTAYDLGEKGQYPGGGGQLAIKTVEDLIGVPIQHYVVVNFDVFLTTINAIGPIQVCPETAIHDTAYPDNNYGFITVDFPAGCQQLDAVKLLQYSRVRHNAGDDFGRASRQQEVIRAVRQKVLSLGGMSALLGKAGTIWGSVQNNLKTDLTFDQMLQLAQVAQTINKDDIRSAVITDKDGYLLPSNVTVDGTKEQVFSPIYENIHDLVTRLFDAAPVSDTQASAENATILVSNGAGIDGLAKSTADKLRGFGFNVVDVANADLPGGYAKSVIKVYTNKMETARYLAEKLGLDGTVITTATNGPAGVDIELIAGKDIAPTNP